MQTLAQTLAQTMKNGISHTTNTTVQSSEKAERAKKRQAALERLKDELQCDEIIKQSWREPREEIDCPICNNQETIFLGSGREDVCP